QSEEPVLCLVDPGVEPGVSFSRWDKELDFHLFEFTGTENEVARGDFVAEGFTDLADTKGWFLTRGIHHVQEVQVHALGGLGAQVVQAFFISNWAKEGTDQTR